MIDPVLWLMFGSCKISISSGAMKFQFSLIQLWCCNSYYRSRKPAFHLRWGEKNRFGTFTVSINYRVKWEDQMLIFLILHSKMSISRLNELIFLTNFESWTHEHALVPHLQNIFFSNSHLQNLVSVTLKIKTISCSYNIINKKIKDNILSHAQYPS